jgi:hypothetical protein
MPSGINTPKRFTVNSTDNVGNASQTQVVNFNVSCHYVAFSLNPATVSKGGITRVTASVMDCTSASHKIALKFTFSGPFGPHCSQQSTPMFTTPPFTIPAGTSQSLTFPIFIPRQACSGRYTTTMNTLISGAQVDSASVTLTVR